MTKQESIPTQYGIIVEQDDKLLWVTKIADKVAYWEDNTEAYLSYDREEIEQICVGLAFNGHPAFPVIIPNYLSGMGNRGCNE